MPFVPIDPLPAAGVSSVPTVDGDVPVGAAILLLKPEWRDLILDGRKTWEIRGSRCNKPSGTDVFLGNKGKVFGKATFVGCEGPLTVARYAEGQTKHLVQHEEGAPLPYKDNTYAWALSDPVRFDRPVPFHHKKGAIIWVTMDDA